MGLIDSIAYGLAGGVAGGAEQAGEVAKNEIANQNLLQLNQQKADLEVQAQQRIAENQQSMHIANAQRLSGFNVYSPGNSTPAQDDNNGKPYTQEAPPVLDDDATLTNLKEHGEYGAAEQFGKANGTWRIAGNAWGKQIEYNDQSGKYRILDDTGARREASAEEIAQMKAEQARGRSDANSAKLYSALRTEPPTTVFGTPGLDSSGNKTVLPNSEAVKLHHAYLNGLVSSGVPVEEALYRGSTEFNDLADRVDANISAMKGSDGKPLYAPGTPEYNTARVNGLRAAVQHVIGGGSTVPSGGGAAPSGIINSSAAAPAADSEKPAKSDSNAAPAALPAKSEAPVSQNRFSGMPEDQIRDWVLANTGIPALASRTMAERKQQAQDMADARRALSEAEAAKKPKVDPAAQNEAFSRRLQQPGAGLGSFYGKQ